LKPVLLLALLLASPSGRAAQWLDPTDPTARDLALFAQWFEGSFDNDAQLWFQNKPEQRPIVTAPHPHNYVQHQRVDAPRLGAAVFYVQASRRAADAGRDDVALAVWRRELVALSAEGPDPRYRLRTYRLKSDRRGPLTAANAARWRLAQLDYNPACDLVFKRVGDQFEGAIAGTGCTDGVDHVAGYRVDERVLSSRKYWRRSAVRHRQSGARLAGIDSDRYLKMRRADFYRCRVNFPVKEYGVPDPGDVQIDDLLVHDQGGRLQVRNPLNDKRYLVQLREKEYPYSSRDTDFFLFRLREVGERRSVIMLSLDPDPQRITANFGWTQVACTAEPARPEAR
jgi:hypothetical protein